MNFKINSKPLFTIIFKLKNDNLKTRDFSPLIERVLAGVLHMDTCLDYVPNIMIIFLKSQFVQYDSRLDKFAKIDEEELFYQYKV